jgi:hypothetical protein
LDKDNNSYITGYTGSTNGISTSSVHQSTNGGYYDVFVAKFTSSGALSWGSYFGGKAEERGFSIALNKSNDIFITGNTLSASGIATEGTHQYKIKGGKDIFLAKFSNDGTRQWGTYYGGAKYDNAYNMVLDTAGNAYITGSTNSTSGIATDSSHQTVLNGAFDIVLAKFSATGKLAWGTYYGGYNDEEGYGITLDAFSNILITGATASSSEMSTVDSYQDWFSGGVFDMIASKFSSEGKIQWGTYFGGYAFDYATDIEADKSGNIYILARTESDTNIASNGSHQGIYGGSSDISIIKFLDSTSAKCKPTQAGKDLSFCGISTPSQLGATPQSGHFYSWISYPAGFNDTTSNPMVQPIQTTTYFLKDSTLDGCVMMDEVKVIIHQLPVAFAGNDTLIAPGKQVSLGCQPKSGYKYMWSHGDTSATFTKAIMAKSVYSLTVIDSNGCSNKDTVTINIATEISENSVVNNTINIYPNPSNNGIVNVTNISSNGLLSIIDLNGKVVFSTTLQSADNQKIETNLSKGVYLLQIKSAESIKQVKWIVE